MQHRDFTEGGAPEPKARRPDDPRASEYAGVGGGEPGRSGETAERAREYGQQAQEKAAEYGEQARERADEGMDRAGERMGETAARVRERAQERGGMQAEVGTRVADSMERTANYLKEHDTAELMDDVERYVKEHPVQAVAGAVVAGFVIGRILR
jgi:ElaB/YqjD/DUF883 family membrane-anchored ribosome-binding protein